MYSTQTTWEATRASFVAHSVKNLPAAQETQGQSLGLEDALEKEMATHSSILFWKISWIQEPDGLQSMGSQRVRHDSMMEQHETQMSERGKIVFVGI